MRSDDAAACRVTPKGARQYGAAANSANGIVWGGLRNMGLASQLAVAVSQFPGAADFLTTRYGCLAASQLNYILGDTGRSFVVGTGETPPAQAHTREGFCTITNSRSDCSGTQWVSRSYPNPNVRASAAATRFGCRVQAVCIHRGVMVLLPRPGAMQCSPPTQRPRHATCVQTLPAAAPAFSAMP